MLNLPQITPISQMMARNAQTNALEQQASLNQQKFDFETQQVQEKAQRQSALEQLTKEAFKNPQALQALGAVSPERAQQVQSFQNNQVLTIGKAAQAFKMTPLADKPKVYEQTIKNLQSQGFDTTGLPTNYDPKLVDSQVDLVINQARDIEKQITQQVGKQTTKAEDLGGATGILIQRYMDSTGASFPDSLAAVQGLARKGLTYDDQGNVTTRGGFTESQENIKQAEKRGADTGALEVERRSNLAKANTALKSLETQSNIVTGNIDKALGTINKFSTGYGSYLSFLPNTDARKLKNYLDTIKANVGFDKLQQMRDNSPTGGALGQVSEMENKLLQAVNGALDPAQADLLEDNLKQIKSLYPKVLMERKEAFNADYGQYMPNKTNSSSKPIKRYNPETGRLE